MTRLLDFCSSHFMLLIFLWEKKIMCNELIMAMGDGHTVRCILQTIMIILMIHSLVCSMSFVSIILPFTLNQFLLLFQIIIIWFKLEKFLHWLIKQKSNLVICKSHNLPMHHCLEFALVFDQKKRTETHVYQSWSVLIKFA